jgi:hypothetical protein
MTARERALHLTETVPPNLFRGVGGGESIAWRLTPEPFALAPATYERIAALGTDLAAFYRALGALYLRSARGTAPAFIAEYLDRGKPEAIVKLARQNRFKSDLPAVIRPDLILTENGFVAVELDSIPGGMGFVGAMARAYCELGYDTIGGVDGMPAGFAAMARGAAGREHPAVAIVVSNESADYREELRWLARAITERGYASALVCAPEEIVFTEEALFARLENGREEKIDVLYRNFELFDLPNIPKHELMLYAARHQRVKLTPPPKAQLEEKLAFALLHHPLLANAWRKELGAGAYARLLALFPQSWVLDPRPLPPQAAIAGLEAAGEPVNDWSQLIPLGKGERNFVVKPSGFSELAWGSRGVKVANDLTKEEWEAALREGLASFDRTPYVLQRFHKGRRVRVPYLDREAGEVRELDGRVRLTPYFFIAGERTQLGGILATVAPADKRLIHGMSDAVMAPCAVAESGY